MVVTVEEMKGYLRVDFPDDDGLIEDLIRTSEKHCLDILRSDVPEDLEQNEEGKLAVMFMTAYLYEHRDDANYASLNLTLRALLFGSRGVGF